MYANPRRKKTFQKAIATDSWDSACCGIWHRHIWPGLTLKKELRNYCCVYLESNWPLFLKGKNPPKQGRNSNQNKGPHLGSRYLHLMMLLGFCSSETKESYWWKGASWHPMDSQDSRKDHHSHDQVPMYMDVEPKIGVKPPKWMVYSGKLENPIF